MRGVYARADQCDAHISAGTPEGFAIRAVVGVDVDLVGDLVLFCQLAQVIGESMVVGATRVFDTDRGVEFIRVLSITDGGHIDCQQFFHLGRDAGGGAMPDLFIVTDQQISSLLGFESCVMQRFDGGHQVGDTGFVVQMPATEKPLVTSTRGSKEFYCLSRSRQMPAKDCIRSVNHDQARFEIIFIIKFICMKEEPEKINFEKKIEKIPCNSNQIII